MSISVERPRENVSSIVAQGLCTGCGTCVSVCPVQSVSIEKDWSSGILVASVRDQDCTECGQCLRVCPGGVVNLNELNVARFGSTPSGSDMGHVREVVLGSSSDADLRYSSSSGGLVTALLVFALDAGIIDGALVTRMKESSPFDPEPFIARTSEELMSASKSKYCPVPLNVALREILDNEGRYAVVGLPCHIHGICKAMDAIPRLRDRIVLLFGLVCNHTPTYLASEYLLRREGISPDSVCQISYRGGGWPGAMSLRMKNGLKHTIPFDSISYWGLVFQKFFFPRRCSICIDKTCELADVSFMDAWLPELSEDRAGLSLAILRTDASVSLVAKAVEAGAIDARQVEGGAVRRSQSLSSVRRSRAAMIRLLDRSGHSTPEYGRPLPEPTLRDCLGARFMDLRTRISAKRTLWMVVTAYASIWRLGRRVKLQVTTRNDVGVPKGGDDCPEGPSGQSQLP